jgi:uncharacterized protein (DUF2267 family)
MTPSGSYCTCGDPIMSRERMTLFQETLQSSAAWIRQIAEATDLDDHRAYNLLCATLWTLRDGLLPNDAVHLAAQLPVLIRGLFYEGWRLADVPLRLQDRGELMRIIAMRHRTRPPRDLEAAVRAVLCVLSRNIDFGETFAVLRAVPDELRDLWPEHMVRAAIETERRQPPPSSEPPPLH